MNPERKHLHDELDKALDQIETDPKFVQGFTLRQWDSLIKNKEQEAEIHRLQGFKLDVMVDAVEPLWETVRRVESEPIAFNPQQPAKGEWQREVIIPDVHVGFWKQENGKKLPMHCEKTIDVGLQIIDAVKPDGVILLGDLLDLPSQSKYPQTPEFAETTNASIEYAHNLLKTIRGIGGAAMRMTLLEGNHDKRLQDSVRRNMMEAYGIKRAGEKLPVLSVPYLLALDQLGVDYVGAYPAGRHFINPNLMCIHGTISKKGGAAGMLTRTEGISTIQAHSHRMESYSRTMRLYNGARQTHAHTAGTWSRIDGVAPSVKSGIQNGKPVKSHEDWQNGMLIVDHNGKDFFIHQIHINLKHQARFEGVSYSPRTKASRKKAA